MIFSATVITEYHCTLERAFKCPMLCDIAKVHTGYIVMPKVTHCTEDEKWGIPGHLKKVHAAKSLTFKGGWVSTDQVLERVENDYWKIEVANFQSWMLGFYKFVGTWKTTELAPGKVRIDYTYDLHAKNPLLYPVNWLFVKLFWKKYMRRVLENIRVMAEGEEPYLYA